MSRAPPRETGSGLRLIAATGAGFSYPNTEGGVPMSELPYFVQCILALLEELPSFLDLIVRHAISILNAM